MNRAFTLLAVIWFCGTGLVWGARLKTLAGHVPQIISHLTAKGELPATNQLRLAIGLPLRDAAGLEKFLAQVYDPASPNFRKFLTPAEFTARFGPTAADYEMVENFARTNGLAITATHGNRLLLDVSGSAAQIEKAFHVTLRLYRHPTENRDFFAPDAEPSVDARLPIADVSGLNNFSRPHSNLHRRPITAMPRIGSAANGAYLGNDFRAAYVPGSALNGSGQMVGLVQFDGYYPSDIAAYANLAGQANVPIQTVLIDGFNGVPTTGVNSGNPEVSLDIEMTMAMAPALSKIILFEGNPNNFIPNDVLNEMAASNTVKNLSSSWGWSGGPDVTTDNIFKQMAAQGQTYFDASGDSDAFPPNYVDNAVNVSQPASSPYITQVGGTTLSTASAGGAYSSETVWNWGFIALAGGYVGSSGGVSSYYSIPVWQQGINSFLSNGGSTTMRNIPDVAMIGDNILIDYGDGTNEVGGGTSCAAPLWAGFMALVNQQAVANGQPSVGFINPAIYELANESIYPSVFHDVTTGDNTSDVSRNAFFAGPGYDLCTGIGTPNGTNLINALLHPDPLIVVSNFGFTAVNAGGGNFNVSAQTFHLTNAAALPLTWSLVNTSAWFNASVTGGTLAAGAGGSVAISLNAAASNSPVGIYTANLWFSNVTSHVGHARLFTLKISDALGILPTNTFDFSGQPGGPFAPATQPIILTNAGSAALNWSVGNTSAWFSVSPASGSLAGGAHSAVTFTSASAATNLANGIYPAIFTITNLSNHLTQTVTGNFLVGQSLVQNGGFETGDFTGWTLNGDGGETNFVDNGSFIAPHSGNYYAALGEPNSLAYLSQTLPTVAGQKYWLSFWLDNPLRGSSTNPNQFTVSWNGSTLYNQTDLAKFDWSNQQYIVTATAASTVLQFGARDDNDYLGLDDVTVIPGSAPAISISPTNQTILVGGNAVFNATVTSSTALAYQWRQNGTSLVNSAGISGATTSALTLANLTTNRTGSYTLFATNIFGATTSGVAMLTVVLPPAISISPTNQTILVGGNAVFNATVTSSTALAYQWRQNGTNLVNGAGISGSTTNVLTLANLTTNRTGSYTLFATNIFGATTSGVAMLTVVLPPAIAGVAANPNGGVTLNLAGSPGVNYVLETTTNLVSGGGWQPLATNVISSTGLWIFNTQTTNFPQRFYRLKFSQ